MKITEKKPTKTDKTKKKPVVKTKKEKVLIVAQEIKFARLLSGNEKKTRDRALKSLKKWLLNCFEKGYEFKESDFTRIWKGLFYAVWMSDKPLVQEELCESIAGILDTFPAEKLRYALMMTKVGLQVLAVEWYGIDYHRMDKCLMLVRRYLRASLRCLLRCQWSLDSCKMYSKMLAAKDGILAPNTPTYARNATSMILHVIDCYLEELAKVSEGDIPLDSLAELLRPFCGQVCGGVSPVVCTAARRLLTALVRQSELGIRYSDKARAWKQMGCPEGGPDALELVSDDDDDEQDPGDSGDDDCSEKPLDPRAGRVDVELTPLPVPSRQLADMLREMMAQAGPRSQKRARICMQRFEKLSQDEYPLVVEEVPIGDQKPLAGGSKRAARSLRALEKKLVSASDELALRGLSRKHRKRLLAKTRAGLSIVEDVQQLKTVSANSANGDWTVEDTEPESKRKKTQDDSEKENIKQKKKLNYRPNGDVKIKNKQGNKIKNSKISQGSIKKTNNNDKEKQVVKVNKNVIESKKAVEKNVPVVPRVSKRLVSGVKKDASSERNEAKTQTVVPKVNDDKTPTKSDKLEPFFENVSFGKEKTKKTPVNKDNHEKSRKSPTIVVNKVKKFKKQLSPKSDKDASFNTPKKVKFVLKNNSMQAPVDYYKSVRKSPNVPFDSTKQPTKANLKPSTPSPINPFFKRKWKLT